MYHGLSMAVQYLNSFKNESLEHEFEITSDHERIKREREDIDLADYDDLMSEIFSGLKNVKYLRHNEKADLDFYLVEPWVNQNTKILKGNFERFKNQKLVDGKYIVINTKITNSSVNYNSSLIEKNEEKIKLYDSIRKWKEIKDEFVSLINSSGVKILLLGEREISKCQEYVIHNEVLGNESIYSFLRENLRSTIDRTYASSKESYSKSLFYDSCDYLGNSICNIHIGNGGGVHLFSQFENLVQLGEPDRMLSYLADDKKLTKPEHVLNERAFLERVREKILENSK